MKSTKAINVHAAKTHLSKLLERVAAGEDVVIARSGKPVARLIRFTPAATRALGEDRHRVSIADDFDAPLPDDLLADFQG